MEGFIYSLKRVIGKIKRKEGFFDFIKCVYYEFILTFYKPLIKSSWSGDYEDITIDRLLSFKKKGFYIDIGAYDPTLGSNTKRFYNKGWSGINIEPDFDRYNKFLKKRKRDINLNLGISDNRSEFIFYKMFPESLSTFSKEEMEKKVKEGYKLISKNKVKVKKLEDIIKEYKIKDLDFVSIDTEGFDINVLFSADWQYFYPKVICIEGKDINIEKYLMEKGYNKYIESINNRIYYRD
ncbi:hypothetical protein A2V49_02590 [candidate division WWE3 bacterium RBG_19FT_COMBO_34_6]|uniref:Methyltransferase FkbM domain-containing protein n=1 Tax=candidate division WWE3 bacterium RBG_19FT_COMBO_34_6 TaxID=1802612 RepID=A0A1F4UKJ5_UNCKA|nr:MAG: hypothetical protein A2V49_02590 [candidate division WWE3 bacterium RBG_19FT_COMBO_34_6]